MGAIGYATVPTGTLNDRVARMATRTRLRTQRLQRPVHAVVARVHAPTIRIIRNATELRRAPKGDVHTRNFMPDRGKSLAVVVENLSPAPHAAVKSIVRSLAVGATTSRSSTPKEIRVTTHDLDLHWYDDALCLQVGADFYPPKGDSKAATAAKKICRMCSVNQQCLAEALRLNDHYGIWGGTSYRQRQKMRREQRVEADREGNQ